MTITAQDADRASHLLLALAQRQEVVQQLAEALARRTLWRAPDGGISINIPQEQLEQLEALVRPYLEESDLALRMLETLFPKPAQPS